MLIVHAWLTSFFLQLYGILGGGGGGNLPLYGGSGGNVLESNSWGRPIGCEHMSPPSSAPQQTTSQWICPGCQ